MLYGFTGAHRSGKTTLARKIAEELNIEMSDWSISATAAKFGYDPVAPMSLENRTLLQTHLLDDYLEMLKTAPRPLLIDRTPLCMAGYLMAEFNMTSSLQTSPKVLEAADRFVELCLDATKAHFDMLFYLGPLDTYELDPSKATPDWNPIFQRHHAFTVLGGISMLQRRVHHALIHDTDFETRREFVHDSIVERMNVISHDRQSAAWLN